MPSRCPDRRCSPHVVVLDAFVCLLGARELYFVHTCFHFILQIGQFVASADAMENGSEREKDGRESMWAGSKIAASTDAKVIATGRESGGEWAPEAERKPDKIQDFAAIVMHQLKKGIDIGSIAVERAHGIRR